MENSGAGVFGLFLFVGLVIGAFRLVATFENYDKQITELRRDVYALTKRLDAHSPACPRCGFPCWRCVSPKGEQEK